MSENKDNFEGFENQNIADPIPEKKEKEITIKKSTYNNILKALVITIRVAAFLSGYSLGTMDNSNSSINNEELAKLLNQAENRALQAPLPAQQPSQTSPPPIIYVSLDDDPVKGDPNAPVTVVEYSDFQCPFCSRFYQQTLPQLEKKYIETGKVKFVYKDFPIDGIHPNARPAHIAAECADEQGKFWEYHDLLFDKQGEWKGISTVDVDAKFKEYATDLGLSSEFASCLKSDKISEEVNQDYLEGQRHGATGTPTFFIGNDKDGFVKLRGAQPFASFESQIESYLG